MNHKMQAYTMRNSVNRPNNNNNKIYQYPWETVQVASLTTLPSVSKAHKKEIKKAAAGAFALFHESFPFYMTSIKIALQYTIAKVNVSKRFSWKVSALEGREKIRQCREQGGHLKKPHLVFWHYCVAVNDANSLQGEYRKKNRPRLYSQACCRPTYGIAGTENEMRTG